MVNHEGKEVEQEIAPHFYLYTDGSIRRTSYTPQPSPDDAVSSKALTFNAEFGLWARISFPTSLLHHPHPHIKLPLVVHFHGGGFLFGSPEMTNHAFTSDLVKQSHSIWIFPSYRLAPEHRLPAAFDDGLAALQWLHSQSLLQANGKEELLDDALLSHIDFSRCFISGASSGCVLAHYLAMKAMSKPLSSASWKPLCIQGVILVHPGFLRGTKSCEEMEASRDMYCDWQQADISLDLALPQGDNKDHPFFNPCPGLYSMDSFVLPKTLVALAEKDPLKFLGLEYIQALKDAGCGVDLLMSHGVGHAFHMTHPELEQAEALRGRISNFIK